MPVTKVTATIGLPFGLGSVGGEWVPDEAERRASWELYVELVTRVSVVELPQDQGLLREVLNSYYSLFSTTRAVLKTYGPQIASPASGSVSFGHLAVAVLNWALRPLLSKWHPLLQEHESRRPADVSQAEWERAWDLNEELRRDIAEVRTTLTAYAGILGEVCGTKGLLAIATQLPEPGR